MESSKYLGYIEMLEFDAISCFLEPYLYLQSCIAIPLKETLCPLAVIYLSCQFSFRHQPLGNL